MSREQWRGNQHENNFDVFKRMKPLLGKRVDALWAAYQIGTPQDKQAIMEYLTITAIKHQGMAVGEEKIILEPPRPGEVDSGEYHIGTVEYPGKHPQPFTLRREELLQHLFIPGRSGTGKTTLIIGLLRQLLRDHVPFFCIDWKRSYRSLLHDPRGKEIIVLTVGRNTAPLRINMLAPPPGVEAAEWVEQIADCISSGYLLMAGARNPLKDALLQAIQEHGNRATLRDAIKNLRAAMLAEGSARSRKYGWMESSERSFDELTKGPFGDALNEKDNPMTIEELLQGPIVFELQGLGEDQAKTFCVFLLQAILLLRKNQTIPREVLHHVLCFDEAHNVFPKEDWGKLSVQSKMAREVREYGEGLIAATQQTDVSDSLISNSGTLLILQTRFPRDAELFAKILQVKTEWLGKIPKGQGIARLPNSQPFLFSFPTQPLKNMLVSDEMVRSRYDAWQQTRIVQTVIVAPTAAVLAPRERSLLLDIAAFPISTVTQRYNRLGWNPKTGNTIQTTILNDGLAEFVFVEIGKGRMKFLTLTEDGASIVRAHGGTVRPSGPAGIEHEFWRSRLRDRCEQHLYTVTDEYHLGDRKRADLRATRGNSVIIIEVETGKSTVLDNIKKCAGHGQLIVFFTNARAYEEAQDNIPPGTTILTPDTIETIHEILN